MAKEESFWLLSADDTGLEQCSPKSLTDFQSVFPDADSCRTYLYKARFPNGFECPYCGWKGIPYGFRNQPDMLRCRGCRRNTRLTSGTIMEKSKLPLYMWFWGAFLVTSLTPGMSALQFQKMLGIRRYETAFNMLHKLRVAMVRPERDSIGGEWPVEVDETYVGGATQGEGRGRHHKTLVGGIVEVRPRKEGSWSRSEPAVRPAPTARWRTRTQFHRRTVASPGHPEPQTGNVGAVRPGQRALGNGGADRRVDRLRQFA